MSDEKHYRNPRPWEPPPTHWVHRVHGALYRRSWAWAAGTEAVVLASVVVGAVMDLVRTVTKEERL